MTPDLEDLFGHNGGPPLVDFVELERSVEDDMVAWAEARGWLVRKMVYPGRRGCPDRFFFKAGHLVIIEFKRAGISKARTQQRREHKRYAAVGWPVHVLNSREATIAVLEAACPS